MLVWARGVPLAVSRSSKLHMVGINDVVAVFSSFHGVASRTIDAEPSIPSGDEAELASVLGLPVPTKSSSFPPPTTKKMAPTTDNPKTRQQGDHPSYYATYHLY